MRRRIAPWFGAGLLALVGGYLAAFGRTALAEPATAALLAGLAVAAVLSIAAGIRESVTIGSVTLPWNALVGASDVLVALVIVLSNVRTFAAGGPAARFVDAALIVTSVSLAWIGVQTARDTRHVDLEASPSRAQLVGLAAVAVASMVVGVLLATVV